MRQIELRPRIGRNKIDVFGVTRNVPTNERAVRQYRDSAAPHFVEDVPYQDRRETATGETGVDLGMGEGVAVPLGAVDGETREIAIDVDLEPVPLGRVGDNRFGLGRRLLLLRHVYRPLCCADIRPR